MRETVFIATSLDGFIARKNGDIDWLPSGDAGDGEDYGYQTLFESVDALVMGRKTYEVVLSFNAWPYGDKPVVVLSSRTLEIPEEMSGSVSVLNADPKEVVRILSERGYHHLYIDGGKTIQSFLAEGLIQTLIITRIPILIGSGIPLFGALPQDIHLHLLESQHYENGLVQDTYRVVDSTG